MIGIKAFRYLSYIYSVCYLEQIWYKYSSFVYIFLYHECRSTNVWWCQKRTWKPLADSCLWLPAVTYTVCNEPKWRLVIFFNGRSVIIFMFVQSNKNVAAHKIALLSVCTHLSSVMCFDKVVLWNNNKTWTCKLFSVFKGLNQFTFRGFPPSF